MAQAVLTTQASLLARAMPSRPTTAEESARLPSEVQRMASELIKHGVLSEAQFQYFSRVNADRLRDAHTRERFGQALVAAKLLTEYQIGRVLADQTSGLMFGNYLVRDRLAAGTVGIVFLAEQRYLKRRCALKILNVEAGVAEAVVTRFDNEGRILAQIEHPNVVGIQDAGLFPSPDGLAQMHYLALEYVDGVDLEDFTYDRNAPLGIAETCGLIIQAARGLGAMHSKGILHRDIKPSNMLISKAGEVKIVDFGIGLDTKNRIKHDEKLLGSLDFMSLEQSIDPEAVTPASDIYSLGVTCFWLLAGHTPLPQSKSIEEGLETIRTAKLRKIRDYRPEVPVELEGSILRMLERDPRKRVSNTRDVIALLEKFAPRDEVRTGGLKTEASSAVTASPTEVAVYQSLATLLELRDGAGPQRGKRLTETVEELCRSMPKRDPWTKAFTPDGIKALCWAVRLNDLAWAWLPEKLSSSKSLLTKEEVELQRKHPGLAADYLEKTVREAERDPVLLPQILPLIEMHHERHDGTGPRQMRGEEIPYLARIAAFVDAYESLRRTKRNRVGEPHELVVPKMLKDCASHFDPAVLLAFQECHQRIASIYANYPDGSF